MRRVSPLRETRKSCIARISARSSPEKTSVSRSADASTAGRLSRMLFDRGSQTASLQPAEERRVTYSNQTDPTGTRQFPPALPRKLSQTLPELSVARRGKHG